MVNISGFDKKMMDYFNTLPEYVQENIMQGNYSIKNYAELISCCENLMSEE